MERYQYHFQYKTSARTIWEMSMYQLYGSIAGVTNILLTVSMVLLTISFWNKLDEGWKLVFILLSLFFILFQPVILYLKSRKRAEAIKEETILDFDESGIYITVGEQHQSIPWRKIRHIAIKPTLVIIYSDAVHGYVISRREMKEQEKEFKEYLKTRQINQK